MYGEVYNTCGSKLYDHSTMKAGRGRMEIHHHLRFFHSAGTGILSPQGQICTLKALKQGSTNIFCKGPDKYFRLWGSLLPTLLCPGEADAARGNRERDAWGCVPTELDLQSLKLEFRMIFTGNKILFFLFFFSIYLKM